VNILRPSNNSHFAGTQQIVLRAAADDVDDGTLAGPNVVWHSSLAGALGAGGELFLNAAGMTKGTHLITVTAYDSNGVTNSATVMIRVWENAIPRLKIARAGGQAVISWPSLLATNWVLQSGSDPAGGSWATFTNAPATGEEYRSITVPIATGAQYFRMRKE
jgi:hypothetical protein